MTSPTISRSPDGRPWAAALMTCVAYVIATVVSLRTVTTPESIALFWPPNGILLAALLLTSRRRWPEILALCLVANFLLNRFDGNHSVAIAGSFMLANGLDVFLTAFLTRSLIGERVRMDDLRHVSILCMLSAPLGSALSATVATVALKWNGAQASGFDVWSLWWVSAFSGSIIVAPMILSISDALKKRRRWRTPLALEGITVHVLLTAVALIIFTNASYIQTNTLPSFYLCFPFIIWAALRLRPLGASLTVFLLAVISAVYSVLGYGPIHSIEGSMTLKVFWLEVFLIVTCLSSLVLAAVIEERRQSEFELKRREYLLRVAAETAHRLLNASSWQEEINQILAELGDCLKVSRAYIFENHEDDKGRKLVSQRHEWTAPGITAEIDNPSMQNLNLVEAGFERWYLTLKSGECIVGHTREAIPAEREFLEEQSILSYLCVPIIAGKTWWGHMGFDDCAREREWMAGEIEILRMTAESLGASIHRRMAETALRESELRFRLLAENIPGVVYMCANDSAYRMFYLNDQVEALTGYRKEEFLDNRVSYASLLLPEESQSVRGLIDKALSLRRPYHLVYRIRHKAGHHVWVEEFGAGVFASSQIDILFLQGFIRDITERMLAEEALKESEARYKLLADYATDIITLQDATAEARQLYVSPSCEMLMGFKPSELIGRSAYEFIHPDDVEHVKARLMRLRSGERAGSTEYRLRKLDGSYCWVESRARVRRDNASGEIRDIIAVTRDVTERRKIEQEQREIQVKIQQAQKLESLGVLAGGIAHDFNNLLVGILGSAGLALMDLSPESPARDTLLQIEASAQRAADLTRQMLAYSGKGRFIVEQINLSKLVEEMAHLLKVSISKNVVLKLDLGKDLPPVEADATQLRQIVMNLIINASEAIGQVSGVISVHTGVMHCAREYLSATYLDEEQDEGYYTYVEVADTGCGMDEATRARIFDPFFTTKTTGRGLGLGAVLGIVRSHKGFIKVYSEIGRGTTFKVGFPSLSEPSGQAEKSGSGDGAMKGTILVVDDETTVRTILMRVLEHAGLETLPAATGDEGVRMFKANMEAISAVMLDISMPGLSGEEVFREIRQSNPNIPIILMSGYNEQFVMSRFMGKSPSGFLQKPFRSSQVLEILRNCLEA